MKQSYFRDQANSYRNHHENNPDIEPGYFERQAAMYEALAILDENGALNAVMDTGIFNDVIEAYCTLACKRAGLDEETATKVLQGLSGALDNYTAAEAVQAAKQATAPAIYGGDQWAG